MTHHDDPLRDVREAQVPPAADGPDLPGAGKVFGRASVTGSGTGSAVTARARASVPVPSSAPEVIDGDDESLRYVEGKPGQGLAEDLAEQRLKELPTAKEATRAQDEKRRVMPLWQELPLLIVVSFCVAVLVRSFLMQAFVIPSGSMEDTLLIGDRVMVDKIVYEMRDPWRGEVVVFRGTELWAPENVDDERGGLLDRIGDTLGDLVGVSRPGEKDFVKRVIGLPGDRVACCDDGRVTVNGVPIDEPYLSSNSPLDVPPNPFCGSRRFAEVVVPPGELFVMGDNRGLSQDSRCQGTVPIDNVLGRAFFRVWPPSHWGGISTPTYPSALAVAGARDTVPVPDPASIMIALTALAVAAPRRGGVTGECAARVRCVRG